MQINIYYLLYFDRVTIVKLLNSKYCFITFISFSKKEGSPRTLCYTESVLFILMCGTSRSCFFFFHNVSVHTKRISQQTCDLKILTVVIIFILYCLCRSKIPIKIKELAYFHQQEVKIIMFSLLFIFQISDFVVSFNCTSPTPVALFEELDKDLFSKKTDSSCQKLFKST